MEVLQRGNPTKGISVNGGIIQVEQKDRAGLNIVLDELRARGYKIISIRELNPSGWAVGIELEKAKNEKSKDIPTSKGESKKKDIEDREDR